MRSLRAGILQNSLFRTALKVVVALGVERFATYSGWFIWLAMGIVGYQEESIAKVFAVGLALELIHAQLILEVYLWGRRRGYDVTGVDDIKDHLFAPVSDRPTGWRYWWWRFQSFYKWVGQTTLTSYWLMILLGSNVFLGTDYVTLVLIRKDEGRMSVFWRVMLPAALASILFGTAVIWGGLEGLWWIGII